MSIKPTQPLVRDAYALSVSAGILHATEAAANAAKLQAEALPAGPETARLRECVDAFWLHCMFLFSAGRDSVDGMSAALEAAEGVNDENARRLLTESLQIAQKLGKTKADAEAAARVERHLLDCGTLVGRLFAEGRAEGLAVKEGIRYELPVDKHKTV